MRSVFMFAIGAVLAITAETICTAQQQPYGADFHENQQWASDPVWEYGVDPIPGVTWEERVQPAYGIDGPPSAHGFPTAQDSYRVWSAGAHETHARDEGRLLTWYTWSHPEPSPAVARVHAERLRDSIAASLEDYKGLTKTMREDPKAQHYIAAAEEHLTKAIKECDRLDHACEGNACDVKTIRSAYRDIDRELKAASRTSLDLIRQYSAGLGRQAPSRGGGSRAGDGAQKSNSEAKP